MNLHYRRLNEQISKIKLDIEYDARKQATERKIPVDETLYAKEVDKIKNHYAKKIKQLEDELIIVEDKLFVVENRLYFFHDEPLPESLEEVRRLYMERLPQGYSDELLHAFDITLQSEGILPRVEELEIGHENKLKVLEKRRARGSAESIAYLEETIRLEAMEIIILLERHEKLVHVANQTFNTNKELYSYAKELSQEILEVGEYLNAKKYSEELTQTRNEIEQEILNCKTKRKNQLERTTENPPLREPDFTSFKNNNHPFTSSGRVLYEKLAQLEGKIDSTDEAIASLENIEENLVQQKKIVRAWNTPAEDRKITIHPVVDMTKITINRLKTGLEMGDFSMSKTIATDARSKTRNNIQETVKPKPTVKRGLPPRPVTKIIEAPKPNRLPSMPSLPTASSVVNEQNLPSRPANQTTAQNPPLSPRSLPTAPNSLPVSPAVRKPSGLPTAPGGLPSAPSTGTRKHVVGNALPMEPKKNDYSLPSVAQVVNQKPQGLPSAPVKEVPTPPARSLPAVPASQSAPVNPLPVAPVRNTLPAQPSKELEVQNYSKPVQGKQSRVRKPLPQKPQEARRSQNSGSSDNLPVLPTQPRSAPNRASSNRPSGTIRGMRVARNRHR